MIPQFFRKTKQRKHGKTVSLHFIASVLAILLSQVIFLSVYFSVLEGIYVWLWLGLDWRDKTWHAIITRDCLYRLSVSQSKNTALSL